MSRDIVHILGSLGRGGIETWLMNVLHGSSELRARTVICLVGKPNPSANDYYSDVQDMGIPVYHVPFTYAGFPFVVRLRRFLREAAPRIVHSHLNYLSGWVTLAGFLEKIPVRIAHYHIAYPLAHRTLLRRGYISLVRGLEARTASRVLGCSRLALESYPRKQTQRKRLEQVLYCGIDLQPFGERADSREVRTELGIPANAFVVGHVGRFQDQKNHTFLIDIFAEIVKREPRAGLLLVGDGPLRPSIEEKVHNLGLAERVIFSGVRDDVPRLMKAAMDVFLLPSLYEGLPVTGIEAQAAGLPFVLSDVITEELDIVEPLIRRLSLSQSPSEWAEAVLQTRGLRNEVPAGEALTLMRASSLNVNVSVKELQETYAIG